jgi:cytochrome P450
MNQQPELIQKMREEFQNVIVKPFKQENPDKKCDLNSMMNLDNVYDLKFYIQCFSESLRIEPPVKASTSCMLLEDLEISKYKIKKGTPFQIDIQGI